VEEKRGVVSPPSTEGGDGSSFPRKRRKKKRKALSFSLWRGGGQKLRKGTHYPFRKVTSGGERKGRRKKGWGGEGSPR